MKMIDEDILMEKELAAERDYIDETCRMEAWHDPHHYDDRDYNISEDGDDPVNAARLQQEEDERAEKDKPLTENKKLLQRVAEAAAEKAAASRDHLAKAIQEAANISAAWEKAGMANRRYEQVVQDAAMAKAELAKADAGVQAVERLAEDEKRLVELEKNEEG